MTNQTAPLHPYFTSKARAVFTRAGGNPDNATQLATWAQEVRPTRDSHMGVIVAATGEILAHTRYVPSRIGASYVTAVTHHADRDLINREAGLATAALSRTHGPAIKVTFSDVCTGAGQAAQG